MPISHGDGPGLITLDVRTRKKWRQWLAKHHASSPGIWLVRHKHHTGVNAMPYEDLVREALCFGWIDSLVKRLDDDRYAIKVPAYPRVDCPARGRPEARVEVTTPAERSTLARSAKADHLLQEGTDFPLTIRRRSPDSGDAGRPDRRGRAGRIDRGS